MPSGVKRSQPLVPMKFVGRSGEPNSILSRFTKAAKKAGWSEDEIKAVIDDANTGSYDHLLATIMKHCVGRGL